MHFFCFNVCTLISRTHEDNLRIFHHEQIIYDHSVYMNEFNHLSPNITHYSSNCANIQKIFQEYLNPNKRYLDFKEVFKNFDYDEDIPDHFTITSGLRQRYRGETPIEIQNMNPNFKEIIVELEVKNKTRHNDKMDQPTRNRLVLKTLIDKYPNFFKEIMNSIKNNDVYVPIMEDYGLIRYGKDDPDSTKHLDEYDSDLELTICDYLNLEITQPKNKEFDSVNELKLQITFTIFGKNYFQFSLKVNDLVVAKKEYRFQASNQLDIAQKVPMQNKIHRVDTDVLIYPEISNEGQFRQGSKYRDDSNGGPIHTINNARFTKPNEDNSRKPIGLDLKKYKSELQDDIGVFDQIHKYKNRNPDNLQIVRARFQKFGKVISKSHTGGKRNRKSHRRSNRKSNRKSNIRSNRRKYTRKQKK